MKAWTVFSLGKGWNALHTTSERVLVFLQSLLDGEFGYNSIVLAKNAVAACVILPFRQQLGVLPETVMFLKGAANLKPPAVQTQQIWDTQLPLRWMRRGGDPENLPIDMLVKRLCLLILLVSGQRPQVLIALSLSRMSKDENAFSFMLESKDIKQGRLGYKPPIIVLKKFLHRDVCVYTHLELYLQKTASVRGDIDKLIITTVKPYKPAVLNTISRWLKSGLKDSGVDVDRYGPGSIRSASTSKAQQAGAPIQMILAAGGWTRETTFTKFYSKEVTGASFQDYVMGQ